MGEVAEQWTAQALRPLSEHGWKLANYFGLGFAGQDHVVMGSGGVVLVETKWGGTPWDVDAGDIAFRLAREHGRPEVDPVLVVWGTRGAEAARAHRRAGRRHLRGDRPAPGPPGRPGANHAPDATLAREDGLGHVIGLGLGLGPAGFLLTNWLLRLLGSPLVWIAAGLAMVGAAKLVRRGTRWRWEARSFQVGLVALYLLTAVAVAVAYLVT